MQDRNGLISDRHISDEDLLREADGELGAAAGPVREHLAACWTCRARKAELEQGIVEFVHLYHRRLDPLEPPADGPRALLRARLEQLERGPRGGSVRKPLLAGFSYRYLRYLSPVLVLLLAVGVFFLQRRMRQSGGSADFAAARALPNAQFTPGAARMVSRSAVCGASDSDAPLVSKALAREVFARYSVREARSGAYEVDYLIPPSLGGTPVADNLWPQPYEAGVWNSRVKDALEDRLESMVCEGTLDIAVAQRELSGNWVNAYRRYFHSAQPLLDHLAFVKDQPWRGNL